MKCSLEKVKHRADIAMYDELMGGMRMVEDWIMVRVLDRLSACSTKPLKMKGVDRLLLLFERFSLLHSLLLLLLPFGNFFVVLSIEIVFPCGGNWRGDLEGGLSLNLAVDGVDVGASSSVGIWIIWFIEIGGTSGGWLFLVARGWEERERERVWEGGVNIVVKWGWGGEERRGLRCETYLVALLWTVSPTAEAAWRRTCVCLVFVESE
jgi:hypothetical protein